MVLKPTSVGVTFLFTTKTTIMKRFFFMLLLAAMGTLTAFTTIDPSTSFKAPPFSQVTTEDWTGQIWDGCEEQIEITEGGIFTFEVFGATKGNSVNVRWRYSLHAKAIGLTSGKQYIINIEGNHAQAGVLAEGQFTLKHTEMVLITGNGTTYHAKFDYKRAYNANGELMASFQNYRPDCN